MTFGILFTILTLDLLSGISGSKEAWGFSQTSYNGIQQRFGKRFDHLPWQFERFCWICLVVLTFFFVGDKWQLGVILTSWMAKFMAVHQFTYNWTMFYLKKSGYKIGIDESANTTAEKSTSLFKIVLFVIGLLIPGIYFIYTL